MAKWSIIQFLYINSEVQFSSFRNHFLFSFSSYFQEFRIQHHSKDNLRKSDFYLFSVIYTGTDSLCTNTCRVDLDSIFMY
jgi:hypothetical protein